MSFRPARSHLCANGSRAAAHTKWCCALLVWLATSAGGALAGTTGEASTFVGPAPRSASVEQAALGQPEAAPLGPQGAARLNADAAETAGSLAWWLRTGVALAVVVTVILLLKHALQKAAQRSGTLSASLGAGGRAPSGVLEVLGRYPVARGQTLVLLRMDRRILLLAQTQQGWSTLSEVTSEDDVASLLIKTRDEAGESMSARFEQVLGTLERDPRTLQMDEHAEHNEDDARGPGPVSGAVSAVGRLRNRLRSAAEVGA